MHSHYDMCAVAYGILFICVTKHLLSECTNCTKLQEKYKWDSQHSKLLKLR
jgi:hypothetical protein